jgi:putative glutamine amidotransferase
MRADHRTASGVRCDAIAGEWSGVLRCALPDVPWLPIPNLGREVEEFVDAFVVDAVILAGGEDLAVSPERDETERRLLALCLARGLPVLGVCRGLEVVQDFFGGKLRQAPPAHHAGRAHRITMRSDAATRLLGCGEMIVPSYHRWAVAEGELAAELVAFSASDDGVVEGLTHRSAPIVAVMWHPERPLDEPQIALRLLRSFAHGFSR